jgi:hypothetical protein
VACQKRKQILTLNPYMQQMSGNSSILKHTNSKQDLYINAERFVNIEICLFMHVWRILSLVEWKSYIPDLKLTEVSDPK